MIDGVLVAVTLFSLGLATIMAVITWRVIRLNQRQSAAARADLGSRVARQSEDPAGRIDGAAWPPPRRDVRNPHQAIPPQKVAGPLAHAASPVWTDMVIERTTSLGPGCCDGAVQ